MSRPLSYSLVTPVRDEVENLPRLLACIESQTVAPTRWIIVDTGSTDGTVELVTRLVAEREWIEICALSANHELHRGAPIVHAIHLGFAELDETPPDIVVKLDADVSFEPDYFARLAGEFERDPHLGIASGSCYELEGDAWTRRIISGDTVWGATRAYRFGCLQEVLPFEAGMGWDGIDQLKANMNGWRTAILLDLPFHHHRREGERDGSRRTAWASAGQGSYYMGYRAWFLVLRALNHARTEPAALAMISGYAGSALRREPRCPDATVRAYLRRQQSVTAIPQRMREALARH